MSNPFRHTGYDHHTGWKRLLCLFGHHSFSTIYWNDKKQLSYSQCNCGKKSGAGA